MVPEQRLPPVRAHLLQPSTPDRIPPITTPVTGSGIAARSVMRNPRCLLAALLVAMAAADSTPVRAQGLQTGVISGPVTSLDGLGLPGVTVTVKLRVSGSPLLPRAVTLIVAVPLALASGVKLRLLALP